MQLDPSGWTIAVVGDWNLAILTPDGVRRRLFRLPPDALLNIDVQIDRPGPYKISSSEGIVVVPAASRLDVAPIVPDVDNLANAATIARRALEELPQTPVSAAGVNFRYRVQPMPSALLELIECPLDTALPDEGFEIQSSRVMRVLRHEGGVINLELSTVAAEQPNVMVNFHRESTEVAVLSAWLEKIRHFSETTNKLLKAIGLQGGLGDA